MIAELTTNDMIREAQEQLGLTATNKEIKHWCDSKYNVIPMSQAIYSCLGSESSRIAETFTAKEVSDGKKFIKKGFEGNYDRAYQVIRLIGTF